MDNRVILVLRTVSMFTVLSLLVMGCGPAASPTAVVETPEAEATAPPTAAPSPTALPPEEAPRRGGTIVVAIETDPPTLNSALTNDSNTVAVASKILNGLTVPDPTHVPVPGVGLAESWDISDDGLTYTIHLHKGVLWHDGEPFTCDDVQFTYTEVLPVYHPSGEGSYGMLESVECADDYTAVFHLSAPFAPLLAAMKSDGGAVLPKHLYEGTEITDNPYNLEPIGTGPFMFKEWVRGDHITVVRNPNYFKEGRPFLDEIIFKIIPEPETTIAAFEAGEVDYVPDYRVPKSEVDRISELPGVEIGYDLDAPKVVKIFFNLVDCELCADINVRRAISYAIDRDAIVDLTKYGYAIPAYNPFPPQYAWAFNEDASEPHYDPDMANQILDDAGYERGADGMRFSLNLAYQSGYARVDRPNDVLKEQLKEVGIDLVLNPMDRNVMIEEVHEKYNFELWDHVYSTYGDPALGISRAYTCADINPEIAFVNVNRYCNERVDELFQIGGTAVTLEDRAAAYFEVQEILVEDLPTVELFLPLSTELGREEFVGTFFTSMPGDQPWDWVWWTGGEPMEEGSYEPVEWLE